MTRKENNDYSTVSGSKREFNIDQKWIRNRVLFNDGTYKYPIEIDNGVTIKLGE